MQTIILNITDEGTPAPSVADGTGVLFLPAVPQKPRAWDTIYPLYKLRFIIPAGSQVTREGLLWTNCAQDASLNINHEKFYVRPLEYDLKKDNRVDIFVYSAGAYCYYLTYVNEQGYKRQTEKFYFVAPPLLYMGTKYVPLNSISMQTVVSKWMGSDWEKVFSKIAEKGYNTIHFTPLQKRGASNSPYAIADQLQYDPAYFKSSTDVFSMVSKLREKHRMFSITDIVLNHTASDSPWLKQHPEAGYNLEIAPHLQAAVELELELLSFSDNLEKMGYPVNIKSNDDIAQIIEGIKTKVLEKLKLWEFYVLNVDGTLAEVKGQWDAHNAIDNAIPPELKDDKEKLAAYVVEYARATDFSILSTRFSRRLNISRFIRIIKSLYGAELNVETSNEILAILNAINMPLYKEYDADTETILKQLSNRIYYMRVDPKGLLLGPVTAKAPLIEVYFTKVIGEDGRIHTLANNGWIWGADPLVDFASNKSKAYLRRELIVWSDCVKLRYGDGPCDSPYLWKRMTDYIKMNALLFDGFRIDNCHSTPLHVGEHFMHVARSVKPNLYIVAELFSGNAILDRVFVERLGISSLIREAMQPSTVEGLARMLHEFGGKPIGSYKNIPLEDYASHSNDSITDITSLCKPLVDDDEDHEDASYELLITTKPPAMIMDCTHDNKTPFMQRTAEDTLPNAAVVAFCSSAIGSVYGYDELYPYILDIVKETRTYSAASLDGISIVKDKLHLLRNEIKDISPLVEDSELHIEQSDDFITIHRTNTKNANGFFLIARTKFSPGDGDPQVHEFKLPSVNCQLEFSYCLQIAGDVPKDDGAQFQGIPSTLREVQGIAITYDSSVNVSTILVPGEFFPGSIAVFRTKQIAFDESLEHFIYEGISEATETLDLNSLNFMLYRCKAEELNQSDGKIGTYYIPEYGELVYSGLQGWATVLKDILPRNDLDHPLSKNLRNGHWALDYITDRLQYYIDGNGIRAMIDWLTQRFQRTKKLPYYLVPKYFATIVGIAYAACRFRAISLLNSDIGSSSLFIQRLALTSVQMVSVMKTTSLLPDKHVACMAAGLPHFTVDYMRCWGRDIFLSVRGLLLITGRHEDAKQHILAFAKTIKHGLVPNLLNSGIEPRYNARDAAWYFLQAIQDYVKIVPNGHLILEETVTRRFPRDDRYIDVTDPEAFSQSSTLSEIMFEIIHRHAKGIKYREAKAGPELDRNMTDEGFNVEAYIDWSTGFVHGGSPFNCGTWCDKMGESVTAGTVGKPGTPRNGAAIELVGMLKSALRFFIELHDQGLVEYTGVTRIDGSIISFQEWNDLIQSSFESKFFIPIDPADDINYELDPQLIKRRGIYKDLFRTGNPREDYQLRPNFAVAMTAAPELFDPKHAVHALNVANQVIRGPLGMRTLDPADEDYYPYYNNSEESTNPHTSRGRNYHQGPEWVWVFGHFLRAFYYFNLRKTPSDDKQAQKHALIRLQQQVNAMLEGNRRWIAENPYAGLPELTNKDGSFCKDACFSQAWSSATVLDFFFDLTTK
ncbi:HDL344Wp [Eremothecium sinecaudum]|uniref:Glycogen debranching enzyme n=1 Tax=Eremothecium sinecaudum TaxID=45286 RepID=A0A109UYU7_9SACH|nr:HDL344Wp [Eremothecium sinecaudum]AMD20400.1 HDL344Wp [Eremothecium sinecaudum]